MHSDYFKQQKKLFLDNPFIGLFIITSLFLPKYVAIIHGNGVIIHFYQE